MYSLHNYIFYIIHNCIIELSHYLSSHLPLPVISESRLFVAVCEVHDEKDGCDVACPLDQVLYAEISQFCLKTLKYLINIHTINNL